VRIFSSNHIFASYIAGIIPELGEEDVLTLDFKSLLHSYSAGECPFADQYEQIDHLGPAVGNNRKTWIAHKYNPVFIAFLEEYIRQYAPSLADDASFNNTVLCEKERIAALYTDRTAAGNLASKTSRVLDFVSRCFTEYFKANREGITAFFNDLNDENYTTSKRASCWRTYAAVCCPGPSVCTKG
jgi:DNA helicase-2/ATP-dependent DNA helicase PcrA